MKAIRTILGGIGCLIFLTTVLRAQVPQLINNQGRVAVNGVNFDGNGQFKFALVNAESTTTYWSNDGTLIWGGADGTRFFDSLHPYAPSRTLYLYLRP